jgi:hypothetical protein
MAQFLLERKISYLCFDKLIILETEEIPVKYYIWTTALYGAVTGTLRAVDQKQLERFEMWCWRRMEISCG